LKKSKNLVHNFRSTLPLGSLGLAVALRKKKKEEKNPS